MTPSILLIEDEAPIREMLVDELTTRGYNVSQASNGEEGIRRIIEVQPDLILCDRAMPGMSGFQVLERLRSSHPQFNRIPFVFLTALIDPRDRAAVEHLGPAEYIEKPVDFSALHETLQKLIKI